MRYINMTLIMLFVLVMACGCTGTRFQLAQGSQTYGLSTAELLVVDTMDKALDQVEKEVDAQGMLPGKTATLEILGVNSPAHLHPYVRRLLVARLANRGVTVIKDKKVVSQGSAYYEDDDFEYWSTSASQSAQKGGTAVHERLLSGAAALLKPAEGNLPDLRLILAFRVAGIDVLGKDLFVFEEEAVNCQVSAKLCAFGDSKVKVYEGKAVSPNYVYKRRLLKFIPLPAPYKELETDRRSMLRKLLDGVFGAGQVAASAQAQPMAMQ